MAHVLVCPRRLLADDLRRTLLLRHDLVRHLADDAEEALALARRLPLDLALLDAGTPGAVALVRGLRSGTATRRLPVGVLAREGEAHPPEESFLEAGASDVLRLPPAADWDVRMFRLLPVAPRRDVRHAVELPADARGRGSAERLVALDVSAGGMRVQSARGLDVGERLRVSFALERDQEPVVGTAWVVRQARPRQWGLEFLYLDGDGLDRLREFPAGR